MTTLKMGKNAAIRQIMRERQGQKMLTKLQQDNDTCIEQHEIEASPPQSTADPHNTGIPHAVTFDGDVGGEVDLVEGVADPVVDDLFLTKQMNDWMNGEKAVAEDSLSSSYLVLMEHGLENNSDLPSSTWMNRHSEDTWQHLLEASLWTLSSPEQMNSNVSISGNDDTAVEVEQNVSWIEDDLKKPGLDRPTRAEMFWSSMGALDTADKPLVPQDANSSDEPTNLSLQSIPQTTATVKLEATAKFLLSHSPFNTFRQNSTSIALEETQVYVLKIQALEKELAFAQQQAASEASARFELERHLKTPSVLLRTPASNSNISSKQMSSVSALRTHSSDRTPLPDTLWERNKTLVTEIRFADQTCVELAFQKVALEQQVVRLQEQNVKIETRNQALQVQIVEARSARIAADVEIESLRGQLVEKLDSQSATTVFVLQSELQETRQRLRERQNDLDHLSSAHTCLSKQLQDVSAELEQMKMNTTAKNTTENYTIHQLLQEKKDLETDLEDARDQLISLRDDLVENFESSKDVATALEEQIEGLKAELCTEREALQASKMSDEASKLRLEDLMKQVESLNTKIDAIKKQMNTERSHIAENVSRVVNSMRAQFRALDASVAERVADLEVRLNTCTFNLKSIEDAFEEGHDDQESASVSGDDEESVSRKSGSCGFDATFSGRNESADLALMEEARAHIRNRAPNYAVEDTTESPPTTPSKVEDVSARLSSFDGISHVLSDGDVSILSSPITEAAGCTSNDKFLQHLQWLTSPNSIQEHAHVISKAHGPAENPNNFCSPHEQEDTASDQGKLKISQVHCDTKFAVSKLSDSRSETASLERRLAFAEAQLSMVGHDRNSFVQHLDAHASNTSHVGNANPTLVGHIKNDKTVSVLEEAVEQLSTFSQHLPYKKQVKKMQQQVEVVVFVREALNIALESLKYSSKVTSRMLLPNPSLAEAVAEHDAHCEQLKSMTTERDGLLLKLETMSDNLAKATKQVNFLQAESNKRGALKVRFEALQREKEEAEASLERKSIFPRKLNDEPDLLSDHEQELLASTIQILHSDTEANLKKLTDQLADCKSSLQNVVRERDLLQERVDAFRNEKFALELANDNLRRKTDEQSGLMKEHEEKVCCLSQNLNDAEVQAAERLETIQELDASGLAIRSELNEVLADRDTLLQKVSTLSNTLKSLDEAHCLAKTELDLQHTELLEAQSSRCHAAGQAIQYRDKCEEVATELEKTKAEQHKLRDEFQKSEALRVQCESKAEVQATTMADYQKKISSLEVELLQTNHQRADLRSANEVLYTKCRRLRDCIRKLTKKCDDWESFHERESDVLHQLKAAHDRNRQRAAGLAARCQQQELFCTVEKKKVHYLQRERGELENELDDIALELASLKIPA